MLRPLYGDAFVSFLGGRELLGVLQAVFQCSALATEKKFLEERLEWNLLSNVQIHKNNVVDTVS